MNEDEMRMIEEERERMLSDMFNSIKEEKEEFNLEDKLREEKYEEFENTLEESYDLPKEVQEYVKDGNLFSIGNDLPLTFTYFVLLGQILKNFIRIPIRGIRLDPRFHFIWLQTARTGKTAVWKYLNSIMEKVYSGINDLNLLDADFCQTFEVLEDNQTVKKMKLIDKNGEESLSDIDANSTFDVSYSHRRILDDTWNFDTFSIESTTDSALMGTIRPNPLFDPNNHPPEEAYRVIRGGLQGSGIAHWDEFEQSGIFTQSKHKEEMMMILQRFMNGLDSDSYKIRRKLSDSEKTFECDCQRTLYATSYVPKGFMKIIVNTGALQRAVVFVREVPEYKRREMYDEFQDGLGIEENIQVPIDKHVTNLLTLYRTVMNRWKKVGRDPNKVFTLGQGVKDVWKLSRQKMEKYIEDHPPIIREVVYSFMINTIQYELILAYMIAAIETPHRKEEHKWIVTRHNMHQARSLMEKSYESITDWIDEALKTSPNVEADKQTQNLAHMTTAYNNLKEKHSDERGFIHNALIVKEFIRVSELKRAMAYRVMQKERERIFEMEGTGKNLALKLKEEKK